MYGKVIVGYDGRERGQDALAMWGSARSRTSAGFDGPSRDHASGPHRAIECRSRRPPTTGGGVEKHGSESYYVVGEGLLDEA